jgi:hypothetical protein
MSAPGLSDVNCSPISVNDFFSDAAANTISFPFPALLVDDADEPSFDVPHPVSTSSNSAVTVAI